MLTTRPSLRFRPLLAMALVVPLLAACDERKPAAPPAKPAVGVRAATLKGVQRSFEFVGRIKAVEMVQVRARVEGFLDRVLFREGQDVKAGELLYQLEKVQFAAQVDQARANLASAEAELTNARRNMAARRNWPATSSRRNHRSTSGRRRSTATWPRSCKCKPS